MVINLYAGTEIKIVFTPVPFVSFQSTGNLKDFFVRSKVGRKVGYAKCNRRRLRLNINQSDPLKSFQTKQMFIKLKSRFKL